MTIFYFVAFLSIFFALMTIFTKNPVHSVLYLVITFFTFTVHYILLNAQFLAVVNFIVYMGAIMVLFLFVLMLLNLNKESEPMRSGVVKVMGAVAGMCLLVVVLGSLRIIEIDNGDVVAQPSIGLVKQLGEVLFDKFLLPFEISSILLLTAMVGAVLLAKKDTKKVNG
ncbi:NADH-quinone oxidoreductase subunit J family protein [Sphingobacterium spiritivorum]|uniref:NADH-quinone oxidoreductase subunit J n=2 Tax=Sphingobacterium spiritivorum TaxID=258 RepID=D7VLK5_SPHSI|nr:NADH-quinone oxidoreductase subunit J [Sphingobacterium spiritivorum]EEI94220.1 NADH-ubiquinone/plastoquinone oxidoreductase chain 6 [Sphingobacterium spiritivorum ATCC 33300]EFK58478.1 NADH-ubiquinone/plastoquinone oxidoreductase chain 6 [Sphingobacterium spiritivorum ATCC 33861]QQS97961.1 NADH-quinone oxidoreductase subunit J [Sphingobacterium spiritivorum]QQT37216.1 NADH-quinone oxidoreductase subunit J [Sphingobacterium spiritivorum]WQD33997.1 NADH-quinone oxidoreductase subunit J [Sphi